jgi:hypothetical protein
MIRVTSITTKPMFVGGSTLVNVFKELQISLFPEAKCTFTVQLTFDIFSFLTDYFFPSNPAPNPELLGGHQGRGSMVALKIRDVSSHDGDPLVGSRQRGRERSFDSRNSLQDSSSEDEDEQSKSCASSSKGARHGGIVNCVYLKYCRISEVDLEITTVGFPKKFGVMLDRGLRLNTPSFQRSERIVSWKLLVKKYAKHVVKNFVRGQPKVNEHVSSSTNALSEALVKPISAGLDNEKGDREALLFGARKG